MKEDNTLIALPLKSNIVENQQENSVKNTTSLKSFHYREDGTVSFSILETSHTTKILEPRVYNLTAGVVDGIWAPILRVSRDVERFEDDLGMYFEDRIGKIYNKFFIPEIKTTINKLGYNHKAGILLYGKQGTGKTTMFKKYFNHASAHHNALVFDVKTTEATDIWWKFIQDIRTIQSNPIIIFLDEFDEYFEGRYGGQETIIKKILDGTDSIDNVLFFMTTNYISKIPETVKSRPSRIKYSIEVEGIQDVDVIKRFLDTACSRAGITLNYEKDLNSMKGCTVDELKQYVLDKVMDLDSEVKGRGKVGFKAS